jgi:hypothetical protein
MAFLFFTSQKNNQIVQAVGSGGGDLLATSDYARGWECFAMTIVPANSDGFLRNGDYVNLRANDGHYVTAKDGGGRELAAVAGTPLGWEKFKIVAQDGTPNGAVIDNSTGDKKTIVAIQVAGLQWVSAPVVNGTPQRLVALAGTSPSAIEAQFALQFGGGNVKRPSYDNWDAWVAGAV